MTSKTNIMTPYILFQNTFVLRTPRVAIFADINFKDSKIVERIENYVSKSNLYLHFLILQNLLISGEKY